MTEGAASQQAHREESEAQAKTCTGRRGFLVRASALAGGLALTIVSGCNQAQDGQSQAPDAGASADAGSANEIVLKLGAGSPLAKVGGSQTVETAQGKVIVAHVSQGKFVAVSAVCTHNSGPVSYDEQAKDFFCPLHGSRFDASGKVTRPPAQQPLRLFDSRATQDTAVISLNS